MATEVVGEEGRVSWQEEKMESNNKRTLDKYGLRDAPLIIMARLQQLTIYSISITHTHNKSP